MPQQIYRNELPRRYEKVEDKVRPEQDLGHTALGDELKKDLDELLDEIDEVLTENAEEFVRDFVQGGGE